MSEYDVVSFEVKPVEGDTQVELVINASDGSTWEYGIPYSPTSGRYTFEEVDVLLPHPSMPSKTMKRPRPVSPCRPASIGASYPINRP